MTAYVISQSIGKTLKIPKRKKQDLQSIRESLKRKIEAESPNKRTRRYVKRSECCKQNQMFANNRKEFFRNLGKE